MGTRPSLSVWPGQRNTHVRRRPPISSRICFLGYTIGYIASRVGFQPSFKSLVPMDSKWGSLSKGQLIEMATNNAVRKTRLYGSLGDMGAAARMRASAAPAAPGPRGDYGQSFGATASSIRELRYRRAGSRRGADPHNHRLESRTLGNDLICRILTVVLRQRLVIRCIFERHVTQSILGDWSQ